MEKYLPFDRQDLNMDICKNDNICICCNEIRNDLIRLSECNFAFIIERLVNIKLTKRHKMCILCHIMLRKIYRFSKQIEENCGLLKQYTLDTKKSYNLTRSHIVIIDTSLAQPIYNEVTAPLEEIKCEDAEVKIEYNNVSEITDTQDSQDFEIDIFKNVITNDNDEDIFKNVITNDNDESLELKNDSNLEFKHASNDNSENVTDRKKKPRTELEANYLGKIRTLNLTVEEVMKQREEERNNKKYSSLPHKCEDCIVAYQFEHSLKLHMEKVHTLQENGIECTICKAACSSQISYERHYKRHFKRFECTTCGKRSISVYPLLKHYKEFHGITPHMFKCGLCDFSTAAYRVYLYHKTTRHAASRSRCTICDKTFVSAAVLKCHVGLIHSKSQKTFTCDVCGKRYNRITSLRNHQKSHKPESHFCATCQMTFKTKEILKSHLKRHSRHITDDDKRYTCNECGDKFTVKRSLEDHISFDHLKMSKYSCDPCSKIFKSQRNLMRHKKVIHDKIQAPKNKICDYCGRAFKTTAVLRCHIRTHTGERPLQCPECPSTFAHTAALYTHKKLLHNAKRQKNE